MTDYLTRVAEAVRKLRYYGEVTPSCDDNPTRKLMREAADLLAAAPEAPEHDRPAQWWLAELDQYGNPTLIDGAHGQRAGADQAFYLNSALGLVGSRKYAVARVELSEPVADGSNVNHEAVGTLRMAIQHNAAAPEVAQAAVPLGWKMVPVEPTIEMCIAGDRARLNVDDPTRTPPIYRAMLAAAPEAPQPDDDDFELTCPEPPARDDRKAIKRLSDAVSEICFQSGESEDEFTKWLADGGMLELLESSIKAMKLEKAVEAAGQQNAALQSELLTLYQGYVNQLESGRDKIIALGGDCDPVDVMERNDPWLISARKVLASAKGRA